MKITKDEFKAILRENVIDIDVETLNKSNQLGDLGLDSLGFVTFLFSVEDRFKIQIDERRLEGLNSESTLEEMLKVFEGLGLHIEV
jgi:acyl carrier protein